MSRLVSFDAMSLQLDPQPEDAARPGLDRRGFLRTVVGGTAAIAAVSLLPTGCAREYPQAKSAGVDLGALTDKEYAIVRAAAEALIGNAPVSPDSVARGIDRELALAGDPMRTDMKTVLGLIEHLTILGGHRRRFTALDPEERLAYLRGWSRSRFNLRRAAFQAVKSFVFYFTYIQPETRPLTGFAGPWPERVKIAVTPVDFGPIA